MLDTGKMIARLQAVLDVLDAIDGGEELQELNAQFEDVLFLMEETQNDEDALEQLAGAVEELDDLAKAYEELRSDDAAIEQPLQQLTLLIRLISDNI